MPAAVTPRQPVVFYAGDGPSALTYPAGSLLVIGGPVGVGKSTLAGRLAAGCDAELISLDEHRRDEQQARGLPRDAYAPDCWAGAIERFERALDVALTAGRSVICDVTCVHDGRVVYVMAAAQHQRPAHVIYLDGALALCRDGQRGRCAPVDDAKVADYVERWQELRRLLRDHPRRFLAEGWASAVVLDRQAADRLQAVVFVA